MREIEKQPYQCSDEELVAEFITGNRDAVGVLYQRYKDMITSKLAVYVSNKDDINDLVGDIFIQILISLPRFDPKISKPKTFILSITNHLLLDYLRKKYKKNISTIEISQLIDIEDTENFRSLNIASINVDSKLEEKRRANIVRKAVRNLPEDERILAILYYFDGLGLNKISEILNKKYEVVKVSIHRIRKELKERIKL